MKHDTREMLDKFLEEHDEFYADEDLSDSDHPFDDECPWEVAIYNLAENDWIEQDAPMNHAPLPISEEMQRLCDEINALDEPRRNPGFEAETGTSELGVPAIFVRSKWSPEAAYASMFKKMKYHRDAEGAALVGREMNRREFHDMMRQVVERESQILGLQRELERQMKS